jgi:hypothetical protein
MQERVGHGHPCGGGFTKLAISTQAYAYLQRCETCGALWDRGERSNHRVLASRAASFYPDVVVEPFVLPRPAPASTPLRYWAYLNQGAVFRLYVEVERDGTTEIWAVVSGAVLERCDELDEGPLVECSAERFDQLLATFGAVKAAALRLALAGGLHPVSLKALDLARQFGTEPPAGTSTSPDELAKEVLRPLVRSGAISPHDLVIEGFPHYSTP